MQYKTQKKKKSNIKQKWPRLVMRYDVTRNVKEIKGSGARLDERGR